jgi:hypothetical protein
MLNLYDENANFKSFDIQVKFQLFITFFSKEHQNACADFFTVWKPFLQIIIFMFYCRTTINSLDVDQFYNSIVFLVLFLHESYSFALL